jgi:integrase/recombinase XerD
MGPESNSGGPELLDKTQGSSGSPKRRAYRPGLARRFSAPEAPLKTCSIPTGQVRAHMESWLLDLTSAACSPRTLEGDRFLVGRLAWWLAREKQPRLDQDALRDFLLYVRGAHALPEGRWGEIGQTWESHRQAAKTQRGYKPPSVRYRAVSVRTLSNYWVVLRAFVNWCLAQGILDELRLPPRPRALEGDFRVFSAEEKRRITAAAAAGACGKGYSAQDRKLFGRRDHALVLVLLGCGLRASEACALRWEDVDLTEGRVRVRSHDQGGGAKGNKSRTVWVHRDVCRALRTWESALGAALGAAPDQPIFCALSGRTPGGAMSRGGLLKLVGRIGELAGVEDCHPHAFRHTFATSYLIQTGDLAALQEMLGHESVEMSRKYARFAEVDLAAKARRFHPLGGGGK